MKVITVPDGAESVPAELDEFDREIALTRQNEELMRLLEQRAQQPQVIGLAEVKDLLRLH